jgi:hypothetical protein
LGLRVRSKVPLRTNFLKQRRQVSISGPPRCQTQSVPHAAEFDHVAGHDGSSCDSHGRRRGRSYMRTVVIPYGCQVVRPTGPPVRRTDTVSDGHGSRATRAARGLKLARAGSPRKRCFAAATAGRESCATTCIGSRLCLCGCVTCRSIAQCDNGRTAATGYAGIKRRSDASVRESDQATARDSVPRRIHASGGYRRTLHTK